MRRIARGALMAVAAASASALTGAQATHGEWPQYLGASRDGIVAGFPMPAAPRLVEAWRRPLDGGSASIIVAGGRAYTLGSDGASDVLFALDAASGRDVWKAALGPTHANASEGPGSTPAAAGDLVIAIGSSCVVKGLRIADGSIAWEHDLAQYKTRFAAQSGCSMSPLVTGGVVVIPTGAAEGDRLVALDATTGRRAWSAKGAQRSINTSTGVRDTGAGAEVIYHHIKPPGTSGVTGINASNGSVTWEIDGEAGASNLAAIALPKNRVLLQTWTDTSVIEAPSAPGAAARRVWKTAELTAGMAPAVYADGHLYGFGGNSGEFFKCIDAADGTPKWSSRIYRGGALLVGKTIVLMSESTGLLRLVAADPTSFREIARLQVLKPGARTQTPPSFAAGRIFVRNLDEVVAVEVK